MHCDDGFEKWGRTGTMPRNKAVLALLIGIAGVVLLGWCAYELRLMRVQLSAVSGRLDDMNDRLMGPSATNAAQDAMAGLSSSVQAACGDLATTIASKIDDAGTSFSAVIESAAEEVSEQVQSVKYQVSLVKQSVDKTREAVAEVAEKADQTNQALLILQGASDRVITALYSNFKWLVDVMAKSVEYIGRAIDSVRSSMPRLPMYNN
jgi:methyl-accepting chemotaxis protein